MNDTLDQICNRHGADKGSQWHDFARRYAPFLEPLRDQVGVQFGCSARMWLEAFPKAQIYGVDIRKDHDIVDPRFHFAIGNQRDWVFWANHKTPMFHVIIDDAEHRADASKTMFECLWPQLLPGGMYSIEDTSTLWDKDFASAVQGDEWFKFLIGEVNWHGKDYGGKPHPQPYSLSDLEKTIDSIHFSKHLCIIVKK
jgi:hypothetical protein